MMQEIPLTNSNQVVLVDDEDYERMLQYKWMLKKCVKWPYAFCLVEGNKHKYMHRIIMNVDNPIIKVDHINHNGLDNRKSNLRVCTNKQNCHNSRKSLLVGSTSKYKGVFWNPDRNKWRASIQVNSTNIHLGYYNSELQAARVYNGAALYYYKEFACINDVGEEPIPYVEKPERVFTSCYRGVFWAKDRKKWRAMITVNKKTRSLGTFTDEKDAAEAYNRAAIEHFGDSACLNTVGGFN